MGKKFSAEKTDGKIYIKAYINDISQESSLTELTSNPYWFEKIKLSSVFLNEYDNVEIDNDFKNFHTYGDFACRKFKSFNEDYWVAKNEELNDKFTIGTKPLIIEIYKKSTLKKELIGRIIYILK